MKKVRIEEAPNPLAHSLANRLWDEVVRILKRDRIDAGLAEVQLIAFGDKAYLSCAVVKNPVARAS